MDFKELEKIDSKKMFKTYDMWPDIAKESYKQEFSKPEFKDIDHVVFAGMGGSGTWVMYFLLFFQKMIFILL